MREVVEGPRAGQRGVAQGGAGRRDGPPVWGRGHGRGQSRPVWGRGHGRVSQALLPRTPRFRPRPLRALAAWGSSPSKLQQSKLSLLTPPTSPRGLLAGEGAGGAAGTSCVPHPRQEGRAPGRFPRTAPGLPGWSVSTGSHGLSPALSGYLAPTSARWGGRETARPAAYPGWQRGVWGCCR